MNIITQLLRKVYQKVLKKSQKEKFKESGLEIQYERQLKETHVRYKKQYQIGRCHVDFYLPDINTVVEINGCYAHCCQFCGFNTESYGIPADEKRMRDRARYSFLRSQGYNLMIIWQHQMFGHKTKGAQ